VVVSSANAAAIALRTSIAGPRGDTLASVGRGERSGTVGPMLADCQFGSSQQLAMPGQWVTISHANRQRLPNGP
jgi:hypothetical protein